MKSIKPGRGPSMKSGIVGIFVALFGVFWTFMAISMGAGFMAIFGVIFVGIAIMEVVYDFKNATGENRYSEYDIVDEHEETDPFNERFGKKDSYEQYEDSYGNDGYSNSGFNESKSRESRFCPYCGTPVEGDYAYCNKCGKKLP